MKLSQLKLKRLIAGYSQTELAEVLGVTPGSVSQWETGRTYPSVKRLKKLSEVLDIPVEEIIELEEKVG